MLETAAAEHNATHILFRQLSMETFKSDQLVNFYFDFYLRVFASFSYSIKYRREFLFFSEKFMKNTRSNLSSTDPELDSAAGATSTTSPTKSAGNNWEFVNLEGDLESIESVMVEISEDDLIKLYYQMPLNRLFTFLWSYLEYQETASSTIAHQKNTQTFAKNQPTSAMNINQSSEFRFNYVSMKILSFLDCISRLSLRSLFVYNRLKYKNFSKLIGKTLKETLRFLSMLLQKKSELDATPTFRSHYNNFIARIFSTVIYSPRLASLRWTILSQLLTNSNKLTLSTKWLVLSLMCGVDVYHENFYETYIRDQQHYERLSIHHPLQAKNDNQHHHSPKEYILQSCDTELEAILTGENAANVANSNSQIDIELLSFIRTIHFLIDLENSKNAKGNNNFKKV